MIKWLFILIGVLYFIFSYSDKEPKKTKYDFAQSDIRDAIEASDNYKDYKTAFLFKTKELVDNGRCTLNKVAGCMLLFVPTK